MKKIRCAIYTRKSAEEGLEQEFNSLDAQREACAAYVASHKAEGWVLLPTVYEDAGLSGGTLERPGLQRLLADIDAGLVDQIVVYKVDRLTRSLSDFAKLVEQLEAAGAVFVSVTQSFNTATAAAGYEALLELRRLHVALDISVRDAYGWKDLDLEHNFHEVETLPENDRVRYTISPAARRDVLKRLLAENYARVKSEAQNPYMVGRPV